MLLCVLEVVLRVGQHLKEGLDELLVLQRVVGGSVSFSIRGDREQPQLQFSSSPSWCGLLFSFKIPLWFFSLSKAKCFAWPILLSLSLLHPPLPLPHSAEPHWPSQGQRATASFPLAWNTPVLMIKWVVLYLIRVSSPQRSFLTTLSEIAA